MKRIFGLLLNLAEKGNNMADSMQSSSTIQIGKKGKAESLVTAVNTAEAVGSGSLEVFATPMLAALMENAATKALDLADDQTSVGTYLEIRHLAATPVGLKVWAEAELIEAEGRRLVFNIEAFDEKEKIGEARHNRVIVGTDRFMTKTNSKLS